MKIIILFLIIVSILHANDLYIVTHVGQNKNKEKFFQKVVNDFIKTRKDTIKFVNIIDKDNYLREIDFKFLLYKSEFTPDIFSPTDNILLKKIDVALDLKKYFNFNKIFHPAVISLTNNIDSDECTFFPLEISSYFIFYNKKIFIEDNLNFLLLEKRPLYKNFIIILRKIQKDKRNIEPLVLGALEDDIDNVKKFVDNILLMVLGPDTFIKYLEGKLKWNNSRLKWAFKYIHLLSQYGLVNNDFMRISDLEAQKRFKEKKAAMYFGNTSFLSSEYQPSSFDFFPMFYINLSPESIKSKNCFLVEIGSALSINKYSNNINESLYFLKFLTSSQYLNLWSKKIQTLMSLKACKMGSKAKKVYSFLNNGRDIIYNPQIRYISNEYYLDVIDFYSKVLSNKLSKKEIDKFLEDFHTKVEKNEWYR